MSLKIILASSEETVENMRKLQEQCCFSLYGGGTEDKVRIKTFEREGSVRRDIQRRIRRSINKRGTR